MIAAAAVLAAAPGAASAAAAPAPRAASAAPAYAPLDQPGPPLSVPAAQLRAALYCQPGVRHAAVEPVLLSPATGVDPAENYSWNYEPALTKLGIPWCAYTAPHHTLDDVETSGEYLVYAIRTAHALAGRPIAVLGHSQGGMSMRWALRFWPDTRPMLDDVIGFSGSNHGTTVLSASVCGLGCPAADWQQLSTARFIAALNSRAETFAGISYTEVYTHTDEVVQPNSGPHASAALHTGAGAIRNVATQDLCPADPYEHLAVGTIDPVAYALAVDALTHPGPADSARVARIPGLCSQSTMPGVDLTNPNTLAQILAAQPTLASATLGPTATATSGAPVLKAEPALACYVFAACSGVAAPRLTVRVVRAPRRLVAGRTARLRVRVTAGEGAAAVPVGGVAVRAAAVPVGSVAARLTGRTRTTGPDGTAAFSLALPRPGRYRLTAARAGCLRGSLRLRAVRR